MHASVKDIRTRLRSRTQTLHPNTLCLLQDRLPLLAARVVDTQYLECLRPGLIGHSPRLRRAGHGAAQTASLNTLAPVALRNWPVVSMPCRCIVQEGTTARNEDSDYDGYNSPPSAWDTSGKSVDYPSLVIHFIQPTSPNDTPTRVASRLSAHLRTTTWAFRQSSAFAVSG